MINFTSYFKFGRFCYHPKVARPHIRFLNTGQQEQVQDILHDAPAKNASLQTKLKFGKPNDPYEREADRLADQVVRQTPVSINAGVGSRQAAPVGHILQNKSTGDVQMTSECPGGGCRLETSEPDLQFKEQAGQTPTLTASAVQQVHSLRGGQPLTDKQRAYFEPRFGRDFNQVRLHTDARSAQAAREINARAFTIGRYVFFGAGEYAPQTDRGKRLLVHELAHVVQQGFAGNGSGPRTPMVQRWSVSGNTAVSDSDSDTLWGLSQSITGSGRNWPCIRPVRMQSPAATGSRYPFVIWKGDEFDVSNLTATTGVTLRIHLFDPTSQRRDAGIASLFYPGAVSSPSGDPDVDIESVVSNGSTSTPIQNFLIFGHAGGGSMWGGAASSFTPSSLSAEEPAPTFEQAELGFFPRRCWFTRNATARSVGCNSNEFGRDFSATYLRRGASIVTTTASVRPRCNGLALTLGRMLGVPDGCAWFNGLDFAASPSSAAAMLEGPFWSVADFHAGTHWATIPGRL
jgi:hypothetical protein